jgi:nondiscriminating glutamyl-tRNA synthetase
VTSDPAAPVRVRIAPSPTGPLHIGTARTALFNYLHARHVGGTFILRLEDTDQARSTVEFEQDILDGLHWLGLDWDEGPEVAGEPARGPHAPYRQMERLPSYAAAAQRLLADDLAYPCYCTPEELDADRKAQEAAKQPPRYVGRCARLTPEERREREAQGRRGALRFRVTEGIVAFDDIVRGHVEFDVINLGGDFVIVRADGTPLYHFTVVVDDAAMEITDVIRGEDHLSNTPKHILLFRALGYDVPRFAHLPLILNPDRSKMSKRKSQTAIDDYIAQGFIREALVNYLALLGWSTGTEEEVLALDEIVQRFDLHAVHKGGAVFDRERLEWLNGQWIRRLDPDDLVDRLRPFVEAELAADDVGDLHRRVVDDDREVIERRAVGADDDEVAAEVADIELDVAAHDVVERDDALGDPEAEGATATLRLALAAFVRRQMRAATDVARRLLRRLLGLAVGVELLGRAVAGVGEIVGEQALGGGRVRRQPLHLAVRGVRAASGFAGHLGAFVPIESQPVEPIEDVLLERDGAAGLVGVLEAEDERATDVARVEVVEKRGPRGPDVERPGRAWCDADADRRGRIRGHAGATGVSTRPARRSSEVSNDRPMGPGAITRSRNVLTSDPGSASRR